MGRAPTYPYSLDPATERVYLLELASIFEVIRWRADDLESCAAEARREGAVREIAVRFGKVPVSGATRLIGAIDAFLASYARASLILFPTAKAHKARARHLRAVLGMGAQGSNDRLGDRRLRNGWMHLDEDVGLLAANRDGKIAEGVVVPKGMAWHSFAQQGSVRMVNPEYLTIILPNRGMWSLRPYFHRCSDLQATVTGALHNPHRWECIDGVSGIAAGWSGKPEMWMIRSLAGRADIEVHASSYREVVSAFASAVTSCRASQASH